MTPPGPDGRDCHVGRVRGLATAALALPVATSVPAAALSLSAGVAPLAGVKLALFLVGWLALGVASLAVWRRAAAASRSGRPGISGRLRRRLHTERESGDGTRGSDTSDAADGPGVTPTSGPRAERPRRSNRTRSGQRRRDQAVGRPTGSARLAAAGSATLLASLLLEWGLGVGG